jgi:pSer/pThr/pTyr-binding forkhead associated (FHA) protein
VFEFRLLDEDGVALGGATPQAPEPRTRPVLHYDDGSRNGRIVDMPRFPFTIGRGRDNDLQISVDPALSRMHCRIEKRGDGFWVVDNGSSRGTRLNGEPIDEARLEDGDSIQIGDTQFDFELTASVDELAEDETDEGPAPAHVKKPSRESLPVGEGLEKIRVTNQALGILMAAYDRSGGPGRGEAEIQLMLESAPKPYAPLFDGVRVRGDGLPPLVVLYNVAGRPDVDQRWVLAAGLLDLIDRAVSVAADSLPGEAVDELLEQIVRVNYRDQLRITPVS